MSLEVVKHYKTFFPGITKLMIGPDNSFWMCSSKKQLVINAKEKNRQLKELAEFHTWFIDTAVTSSGDFLFSTDEPYLKVIPVYSTTPQQTPNLGVQCGKIISIHLNERRKRVILGVYMKNYDKPSEVIILNNEGRHEKAYRFFDNPASIATYNNIIAVVNRVDIYPPDKDGSVIIVDDRHEKVINIYKGHGEIQKCGFHPFRPHDVVLSKNNNFIISDTCVTNPIVHILSEFGEFLTYCHMRDDLGIKLPLSLAVDRDGFLYVGTGTFKGENGANLYMIDTKGC